MTEQLLLPLPDDRPPIKEACSRLCKHLGRPYWLSSVGIAENARLGIAHIVVFLRTELHPEIPKEWEGYPIQVKFFGEFAPLGGPT